MAPRSVHRNRSHPTTVRSVGAIGQGAGTGNQGHYLAHNGQTTQQFVVNCDGTLSRRSSRIVHECAATAGAVPEALDPPVG